MVITNTDIKGLKKFISGKVRDVYDLGDELLVIATDRLSAFDVIMPTGIPDKGRVLTRMSLFWFDLTRDVVENHLITADIEQIMMALRDHGVADTKELRMILDGRSMIVKKADPFSVECIVRGCISGSAWKEYRKLVQGLSANSEVELFGHKLPAFLEESETLREPLFTPSTKAALGFHDENITAAKMAEIIGKKEAEELAEKSLAVYAKAFEYASSKGIIIADTKFEFGRIGNKIILIDEVLTPDSSRFWDVNTYKIGGPQPSFDKQFVRNWLEEQGFTGKGTPPAFPEAVVNKTAEKYLEALYRLTGMDLAA